MISLAGLTLATRRFEDAKEILYTFSKYVKDGLIPNMFPMRDMSRRTTPLMPLCGTLKL